MKNSIGIVLLTVAALAGGAHAQTTAGNGTLQLRDIPGLGSLFRAPKPSDNQSLFGADMPPLARLDSSRPVGSTFSILQTARGEVFQLQAVRQNRADILRKIIGLMGARAVIDPQLERVISVTETFRGLSWDDLLASVNYQVEMVKSPSGTYFFADKPNDVRLMWEAQIDLENERMLRAEQQRRADPRYDPFVHPYGGLPVPELKGWNSQPEPQLGWEKREFGGHEFYYIPAPAPAK